MNAVLLLWGAAMVIPAAAGIALCLPHAFLLIAAGLTNGVIPDWAEEWNQRGEMCFAAAFMAGAAPITVPYLIWQWIKEKRSHN